MTRGLSSHGWRASNAHGIRPHSSRAFHPVLRCARVVPAIDPPGSSPRVIQLGGSLRPLSNRGAEALEELLDALDKHSLEKSFLLLYDLLTGVLRLTLVEGDRSEVMAALLLRLLPLSDWVDGGPLMALLSMVTSRQRPWLAGEVDGFEAVADMWGRLPRCRANVASAPFWKAAARSLEDAARWPLPSSAAPNSSRAALHPARFRTPFAAPTTSAQRSPQSFSTRLRGTGMMTSSRSWSLRRGTAAASRSSRTSSRGTPQVGGSSDVRTPSRSSCSQRQPRGPSRRHEVGTRATRRVPSP